MPVELCHMKGYDRIYHNWRTVEYDGVLYWYCIYCRITELIETE